MRLLLSIWSACIFSTALCVAADQPGFPQPYNTEKSKEPLLSPAEALARITVPDGFKVSLFAGEPDVQQPIAMSFDDRGRLWIVENFTYAESEVNFEKKLRDRILIFEDTNNDGRFDKRTVFWDEGKQATSVAPGFGGAYVLAPPDLLFIPDRNHDDVPDGKPEVVLDGFNADFVRHNIANGLMFGPDGWLYGRHGILATSLVGQPGTPDKERVQINCGIWKFHPITKKFEVVAHGTTNPWGLDFNDYGEGFFINTVIGHLFHLIPGAHYKRMYGQDFNPHTYALIDQHADHYHWDTGKAWTESRSNTGPTDSLGGGHAHSGLMMYLGDNWPDKYRDSMFTVNLHGYRLNNDLLQRSGSGYVGKHGPDFLKTTDPWFRAVDLTYGPDGSVFMIDWSDVGECHESDGVHRTSGRIYKISYGTPAPPNIKDVSKLSNEELVELQLHRNDWYVRHARRVLQERAAEGKDMAAARDALLKMFSQETDVTRQLRAMWALHAMGAAKEPWLIKQLSNKNEYVRIWAVRLLVDSAAPTSEALQAFRRIASKENSQAVRLALASALQRCLPKDRYDVALALLSHPEDVSDHNLPLMIWYAIEPLVGEDSNRATILAAKARIPLVRQYISRRLAEDIEKEPKAVDTLISVAANADAQFQSDVMIGMSEATKGWRSAKRPLTWSAIQESAARSGNVDLQNRVRNLSLIFGDPKALKELRDLAFNESADQEGRRAALQKLIEFRSPDLQEVLQLLVTNKAVAPIAIRGLASFESAKTPEVLISGFGNFSPEERTEAINTLVSRPTFARPLLEAVASGRVKRTEITAFHARQIRSLGDANLNQKLTAVWGDIRGTGGEQKKLIAKYKALLTTDRLKKGDLSGGRELFNQMCALCHTLYGEGAKIGPDLTGSGRSNIDYLLENIVDPSAIVGSDFKMSVVTMKDGRILNGIITAQTDRTVTVQSFSESVTLERSEIVEMKSSSTSLMPEGLLEALDETQMANLIAYLMAPKQVPLPKK